MRFVMVLPDGETYALLEGCKILALDDALDDADEEHEIKEAAFSEHIQELARWPHGLSGSFLPAITAEGVAIIMNPKEPEVICPWPGSR